MGTRQLFIGSTADLATAHLATLSKQGGSPEIKGYEGARGSHVPSESYLCLPSWTINPKTQWRLGRYNLKRLLTEDTFRKMAYLAQAEGRPWVQSHYRSEWAPQVKGDHLDSRRGVWTRKVSLHLTICP